MGSSPEDINAKIDKMIRYCNGTSRNGSNGASAKLQFAKEALSMGTIGDDRPCPPPAARHHVRQDSLHCPACRITEKRSVLKKINRYPAHSNGRYGGCIFCSVLHLRQSAVFEAGTSRHWDTEHFKRYHCRQIRHICCRRHLFVGGAALMLIMTYSLFVQ